MAFIAEPVRDMHAGSDQRSMPEIAVVATSAAVTIFVVGMDLGSDPRQ
jgi:hypothetical protein